METKRGVGIEYWPYLVRLVSYHQGYAHDPKVAEMWGPAMLNELTPKIIEGWMNQTVFGMSHPGPDNYPTLGHASSLEFMKKAISFFMPNRLLGWNVTTTSGNPTKSIIINDLIKRVKKWKFVDRARQATPKEQLQSRSSG